MPLRLLLQRLLLHAADSSPALCGVYVHSMSHC